MQRLKLLLIMLLGVLTIGATSGCASGGFKLTRQYAGWLNSQPLILRIVLYILGGIVFTITLLVDVVAFNTMDFWEGKISAGSHQFESDGKIFLVDHSFHGEKQNLRQSRITVKVENQADQVIELIESEGTRITLKIDGKEVKSYSYLEALAIPIPAYMATWVQSREQRNLTASTLKN